MNGRTAYDDLSSNEHDLTKHGIFLTCTDGFEICKVSPVDSDILMVMIGKEAGHIIKSTPLVDRCARYSDIHLAPRNIDS